MDLRGFYQGQRVLITGNTGFKGTWLAAWLEHLGAVVGGISKDIPTKPSAFEDLGGKARFATAFVDIRDGEATTREVKLFEPTLVFHLAAQSLVRPSYANPVETWGTNVMGTLHVLEAIRQTPSVAACAVISSDKCYENLEWDFGYRETDRLGGKDPYSASKAGTELVFKSHFESFLRAPGSPKILSFRAGNVIGGGDWAIDRIIPDCIRAFRSGERAVIRNPGATRPWQHVLEPLGGYLVALARAGSDSAKNWGGESFNFGPISENSKTVGELVAGLAKVLPGFTYEAAPTEGVLHEAKFLKVSAEKAGGWMGWRPTLAFDETVGWTAEGYAGDFRKHVEGKIAEFGSRIERAGFGRW